MANTPSVSNIATSVVKVSASLKCRGVQFDVSSFSLSWGLGAIPTARVSLAPLFMSASSSSGDGRAIQHLSLRSSDYSSYSNGSTYDFLSESKNDANWNKVTLSVSMTRKEGNDPQGFSFDLNDWRITNLALEKQNRVSVGCVVATIAHPSSLLMSSPGYFFAAMDEFKDKLEDAVTSEKVNDVIGVADATLDVIQEAIGAQQLVNKSTEDQSATQNELVKASGVRIGHYFGTGLLDTFPYVSLFPTDLADYAKKACKIVMAEQLLNLRSSTPFQAFLGLLGSVGASTAMMPDGDTGWLVKIDPWDRSDAAAGGGRTSPGMLVPGEYVAEVEMLPDSDPICGVRIRGMSVSDAVVITTLQDVQSLDKNRASSLASDTMYFYGSTGKIVNTTVPEFARAIASKAALLKKKASGEEVTSTSPSNDNDVIVNPDEFDATVIDSVSDTVGTEYKPSTVQQDIREATAETVFAMEYRRAALLRVVLVPSGDGGFPLFPAPGSLIDVDVGTGGSTVEGILSSAEMSASCANCVCTTTLTLAYAGDPPKLNGNSVPRNRAWD